MLPKKKVALKDKERWVLEKKFQCWKETFGLKGGRTGSWSWEMSIIKVGAKTHFSLYESFSIEELLQRQQAESTFSDPNKFRLHNSTVNSIYLIQMSKYYFWFLNISYF